MQPRLHQFFYLAADLAGPAGDGHHGGMHKTAGLQDPAAAFPLPTRRDDV